MLDSAGRQSAHLDIRIVQAASEDELRLNLGLMNYTTGKGKVPVTENSLRPIEIFMCSVVSYVFILIWYGFNLGCLVLQAYVSRGTYLGMDMHLDNLQCGCR